MKQHGFVDESNLVDYKVKPVCLVLASKTNKLSIMKWIKKERWVVPCKPKTVCFRKTIQSQNKEKKDLPSNETFVKGKRHSLKKFKKQYDHTDKQS